MAWEGSTRKATLPSNWDRLRRLVLERDGHRCTWMDQGVRCDAPANQVDHVGGRLDHDPAHLRSLCEWHHNRVSSKQGNAARTRLTQRRPRRQHPGIVG